MPTRTRGTRSTKALKENICVVKTNKSKGSTKVAKTSRQPLADKTNSASDDNASVLLSKKKPKTVPHKEVTDVSDKNLKRPRRTKRIPTRYKENIILNNLSVTHNDSNNSECPDNSVSLQNKSPVLNTLMETRKTEALKKSSEKSVKSLPVLNLSPMLKVPLKGQELDWNLATNRPKRICRLPRKFNDHSISPNKYIPVQPINASTPLVKKNKTNDNRNLKENRSSKNVEQHTTPLNVPKKRVLIQKLISNNTKQGIASDTNNNARQKKQHTSPLKSPVKISVTRPIGKKLLNKSNSPKLLDGNKKQLKRDSSTLDVYEFIYDPNEEPQPAKKKKRKQTVRKPKPKTITIKSNYDKNLAKALAALKNTVSSKSRNIETMKRNEPAGVVNNNIENEKEFVISEYNTDLVKNVSIVSEKNYNSVRIEDIANDIQPNEDDHAVDYSPINSPSHSNIHTDPTNENLPKLNNADPLNLQDNLSFFDDIPVASSSMNVSVRHPLASPWRVEFGNLPIKWQSNTYVKPNMTPAVESSFINFNDSKKKHVYTNMVPEANDSLPKIDDPPNLIQTSIISFIKEVAEKQANKKNKKNITPVKANSLFEETTTMNVNSKTPNKQTSLHESISVTPDTEKESDEIQLDNISEANNVKTPKDLNKSTDKNNTYFGFDDIEDQENISPIKKNNRAKSLRSRTRGILQEINGHKGPTRVNILLAAESKALKNKLPDQIKAVTKPQIIPEISITGNTDISSMEESLAENLVNDDSQSVHLFEDIEFLHNHKASCKSYTKAKKVTFHNKSIEHSDDSSVSDINGKRVSGDEDDLDDISFRLPSERPKRTKKKKPKKQLSKKEEKEVEAWAANFNSMCEDIDEFDLVVE